MAMASQREVEGIGQESLPHFPPQPPRTPSHPPLLRPSGGLRKKDMGREGGRQEGSEGQREGGEGQRKIRGRWEWGSGGVHGGQGSLALRGEGVRSGGSSLLPPTRFSSAETAGGWGGGAGRRGEEAAGGKRGGDRARVGLPLAAPSTALETALPPRLAGLSRPASSSSSSLPLPH